MPRVCLQSRLQHVALMMQDFFEAMRSGLRGTASLRRAAHSPRGCQALPVHRRGTQGIMAMATRGRTDAGRGVHEGLEVSRNSAEIRNIASAISVSLSMSRSTELHKQNQSTSSELFATRRWIYFTYTSLPFKGQAAGCVVNECLGPFSSRARPGQLQQPFTSAICRSDWASPWAS